MKKYSDLDLLLRDAVYEIINVYSKELMKSKQARW